MAAYPMKRWAVIWLLMLAQIAACYHQPPPGEPQPSGSVAGPALVTASSQVDFGAMIPGRVATRTLTLENRGGLPLRIRTVRTSDPFQLKIQLSDDTISASGSTKLRIELVPDQYHRGSFNGDILIYTNDPGQPVVKIAVTAAVDPPIDWRPPIIRHVVRQGQPTPLPDLMVVARDEKGIGSLVVDSSIPAVTARAKALDDGSQVISFDMDPHLPLGVINGHLTVKTHHPEMPLIDIPMVIYIQGNLTVDTPVLELGILAPNAPASAVIGLTQQGDRPVRITRVEPHLPVACDVDVDETPTGYKLILNLTETPPLQDLAGQLRIFTDHPTQSPQEVPTEGWIAAEDPFAVSGGNGTDDKIFQLLMYALFMEDLLTPEEVVDDILGSHRDRRSLDLVLRAFASENWYTRLRAMQVLGQLGQPQAVETIRRAVIADPDEDVRAAAVAALVDIVGSDALPELALALQDNDEFVRADAAKLLGKINDQRAVPLLLQAKNDEEELVREEAKRSLDKIAATTK